MTSSAPVSIRRWGLLYVFEELPMIDRLKEVVGPVVEDTLENDCAPDDRQGERRRPLPDSIVEPGQRHL